MWTTWCSDVQRRNVCQTVRQHTLKLVQGASPSHLPAVKEGPKSLFLRWYFMNVQNLIVVVEENTYKCFLDRGVKTFTVSQMDQLTVHIRQRLADALAVDEIIDTHMIDYEKKSLPYGPTTPSPVWRSESVERVVSQGSSTKSYQMDESRYGLVSHHRRSRRGEGTH